MNLNRELLQVVGALSGGRARTGPSTVQIDLTDACNQRCEVCWLHADSVRDLVGERASRPKSLPWARYETLLAELRALNVRELYFAGGGEPLAHPRAWDALRAAVEAGFEVTLHTNLSLAGEDAVERILATGLHHLCVSLWAGDVETWQRTHPGARPETFHRVTQDLRALRERRIDRPLLKTYHVLTAHNGTCAAVGAMWSHAEDTGVDAIEFAVADIIPGATDHLGLDSRTAASLLPTVEPWLGRALWRRPRLLGGAALVERLRCLADGRPADASWVHEAPCYAGWTYARVMADGRVIPCLKAHRLSSGDIHTEDFASIWHGVAQSRFRAETTRARKTGPYFQSIGNDPRHPCGCELGCDNRADNDNVHARIEAIGGIGRLALRAAAKVLP